MKLDHVPAATTATEQLIEPAFVCTPVNRSPATIKESTVVCVKILMPSLATLLASALSSRRFSTWMSSGNSSAPEVESEMQGSNSRAAAALSNSTASPARVCHSY